MKTVLIVIIILLMAAPLAAQNDCGAGLPCGPLPWPVPKFPVMLTPTPIPTIQVTFLANPELTATATPTATLFFDQAPFEDSVATYNAVIAGTPLPLTNLEGTPVDTAEQIDSITVNVVTYFQYFKGLTDLASGMGWFGVLIGFTLILFVAFLSVKLFTFFLPIFLAVLGFFKRVFDVIMEFIPL